jgi:hypothetical protein
MKPMAIGSNHFRIQNRIHSKFNVFKIHSYITFISIIYIVSNPNPSCCNVTTCITDKISKHLVQFLFLTTTFNRLTFITVIMIVLHIGAIPIKKLRVLKLCIYWVINLY